MGLFNRRRRSIAAPTALCAALILTLGVSACGSGSDGSSGSKSGTRDVSLILDYTMDGAKAPLVLGIEKGFFKDAGINLKLIEGTGSSNAVKFVASGQYPFGFATSQAVAIGVDKGLPIKMIGIHTPESSDGVWVQADGPVSTINDLIGRKIATGNGGSSQTLLLPGWIKAAGLDYSKIKVDEIPDQAEVAGFLRGKYDGFVWPFDDIAGLFDKSPDSKLRFFPAAKYANVLGTGLFTTNKEITSDSAFVKKFVNAYAKSYLYAADHTDELLDVVTQKYPELTRDVLDLQYRIDQALSDTPASQGKPFGYMAPDDWASTLTALKDIDSVTTISDPTQLYTDEFIGTWGSLKKDETLSDLISNGGVVTKDSLGGSS